LLIEPPIRAPAWHPQTRRRLRHKRAESAGPPRYRSGRRLCGASWPTQLVRRLVVREGVDERKFANFGVAGFWAARSSRRSISGWNLSAKWRNARGSGRSPGIRSSIAAWRPEKPRQRAKDAPSAAAIAGAAFSRRIEDRHGGRARRESCATSLMEFRCGGSKFSGGLGFFRVGE
jgi:hypothetical protein